MLPPTPATWALVLVGMVFLFPVITYVQIKVITAPRSRKTEALWMGKGGRWRDETQVEYAIGTAWADLISWLPMSVAGSIGSLLGHPWGYGLLIGSGTIAVYINTIYWFSERKYLLPIRGALAYYTYEWGAWMVWGIVVVIYAAFRLGMMN